MRTKPRRLPGVTCWSSRTRNRSAPTLIEHALLEPCRLYGSHRNLRPENRGIVAANRRPAQRRLLTIRRGSSRVGYRPARISSRPAGPAWSGSSTHHAEAWTPPIDVYETDAALRGHGRGPRARPRRRSSSASRTRRLTIRGRRRSRPAEAAAVTHFHQVERGHGAVLPHLRVRRRRSTSPASPPISRTACSPSPSEDRRPRRPRTIEVGNR